MEVEIPKKHNEDLLKKVAKEIHELGHSKIEGVLTPEEVKGYVEVAREITRKEQEKVDKGLRDKDVDFNLYQYSGNHFYNPTREYRQFDALIGHPLVHGVLENLFHTKAILSQTELRNPAQNLTDSYAFEWHRDGRQVTEDPSWIITFWMLNDVDMDSGPTEIIERTHRLSQVGYDEARKPAADADVKKVLAKAGDLVFMNANLLHRGTLKTSSKDRWYFIPTYSPWYFKPSMDYTKVFTRKQFDALTDLQKQTFGFTTVPPHDERKRVYTMRPWQDVVHEFQFMEDSE
ncbi:MAG TPA: hypothetical protein DCL41_05415 [Bdellovibrionales bacterium]|nr:hypothetical protein [Pseudobdellovibrionaceae bacterium]HAG91287.1 hypothetical protein [Bdellovibrionales bacterium]|tara:strand:+ start:3047 stop:3913 length:867 start_codon:yes stop_codon:yes gene_type:complete